MIKQYFFLTLLWLGAPILLGAAINYFFGVDFWVIAGLTFASLVINSFIARNEEW